MGGRWHEGMYSGYLQPVTVCLERLSRLADAAMMDRDQCRLLIASFDMSIVSARCLLRPRWASNVA
jgi:hypothetical protein